MILIKNRAQLRKAFIISTCTSFAFWGFIGLFTSFWLLLIPLASAIYGWANYERLAQRLDYYNERPTGYTYNNGVYELLIHKE